MNSLSLSVKNSLKIALVFAGSTIGAGFISGQEIMSYFNVYGKWSFLGILLTGFLFGLLCYCVLRRIYCSGAVSPLEYFGTSPFAALLRLISMLSMGGTYVIMVAAGGALAREHLGLPSWVGIAAIVAISSFFLLQGAEGLFRVNILLTPLMLLGVAYIAAVAQLKGSIPVFAPSLVNNWGFSSFVYVSYNSFTLVSVMISMWRQTDSKKTAMLAGMFSGIILASVAMLIWIPLQMGGAALHDMQIPMLYIAGSLRVAYIPVFCSAIITAAVSCGSGLAEELVLRTKLRRQSAVLLVCTVGIVGGFLGFQSLIQTVYATFGYVGFLMIGYVLLRK